MRYSPKILIPMLLVIGLATISTYATAITVTNVSNNGIGGNYFVDNDVFTFSSAYTPQYQVASTAQPASVGATSWSDNGIMYANAVTAGDWTYGVTVTIATDTAATYTITVAVSQNGGAATTYTTQVTLAGTETVGRTMTVVVDLGTSMTPNISTEVSA